MFSQPGKNSTSKFRILLEKDFILKKKFRLKYPEKKTFLANTRPIEEINRIADEEQKKLEIQQKEKKIKFRQLQRSHSGNYLFKVQSRNDYYESTVSSKQQIKSCAPPPGSYNIVSVSNDKHKPAPNFKAYSRHRDNFITNSYFFPSSPRKPLLESKSMIPYNKQLKQAHKSQNTTIDLTYNPDYSLVSRKVMTVDMKKIMPRKKLLFKAPESSADYEPNKEAVMVDLGKVPNISLVSKRKELFPVNPTPDPYDVNLSLTVPKSHSFQFSKMLQLEVDSKSPLPSFMQTIHNRTSILHSSMKTLNLN